jgi:hypothetical protein
MMISAGKPALPKRSIEHYYIPNGRQRGEVGLNHIPQTVILF